jgi:hypothetical protein
LTILEREGLLVEIHHIHIILKNVLKVRPVIQETSNKRATKDPKKKKKYRKLQKFGNSAALLFLTF